MQSSVYLLDQGSDSELQMSYLRLLTFIYIPSFYLLPGSPTL